MAAVPDDALMQQLSAPILGVLKLLRGYIRSLESSALTTSVEGREIVRRHMLDLTAIAATSHRSIGGGRVRSSAHSRDL